MTFYFSGIWFSHGGWFPSTFRREHIIHKEHIFPGSCERHACGSWTWETIRHWRRPDSWRIWSKIYWYCSGYFLFPTNFNSMAFYHYNPVIMLNLYVTYFQAGQFIDETGIDALAVCIGNVHGKYHPSGPNLRLDLLKVWQNSYQNLCLIFQIVCVLPDLLPGFLIFRFF